MWLAGTRPGGRLPFLLVQERKQRTRPHVCDPFAALRGKPVAGRLRGGPHNSLRCYAAPFKQTRPVRSRRHGRCDAHAHPASAPPQAQPQGGGRRHGPSLRSAWPSRREAPARARPSAAMARVGASTPYARTEKRRARGGQVCRRTHLLRGLTCCVCLNGAAQQRSELRSTALRPSIAGCPVAKRRGYGHRGRTSFASFSCASKKRRSPAGASPGQRHQNQSRGQNSP